MATRLLKRLFWSMVTLLGTAVLTFLLINLVPGDVSKVIAGPKAGPEVIQQIRAKYHLDDPLWKRLGHYLGQLATGDLGRSYLTEQSVASAILSRLPTTIALSAMAVVMWMVVSVPLGVLTARYRGSRFDRVVLVLAAISLSLPSFWLARMMQYWLSYKLGWFPVAGFRSFQHLLLPSASLAILFIGYYSRLIHTNMCEVLDSQFIRCARAKGVSEVRILFRHALRNAMIPVVTVLGIDIAGLLAGVLFVESVFALPGVGTLAVQSVFNLDVPIIMGTVLLSAVLVVVGNLIVDMTYGWIDPRMREAY